MIDEKKLVELPVYRRVFTDAGYPMSCLDAHDWDEVKRTLEALWKVARAAEAFIVIGHQSGLRSLAFREVEDALAALEKKPAGSA